MHIYIIPVCIKLFQLLHIYCHRPTSSIFVEGFGHTTYIELRPLITIAPTGSRNLCPWSIQGANMYALNIDLPWPETKRYKILIPGDYMLTQWSLAKHRYGKYSMNNISGDTVT